MRRDPSTASIVRLSPVRHQMIDWLEMARTRHMSHALIEVDVTNTRKSIREYRVQAGAPLSLTSYVIWCLGKSIGDVKAMHGYRQGKRRIVIFDDVDIAVAIEHDVDGEKVPTPHLLRAVNRMTPGEVQTTIAGAQSGASLSPRLMRWLPLWMYVPGPVRRLAWRALLANPYRRKHLTGTVMVTAVGMFGSGAGWGIPNPSHTLCLTIGGIAHKPALIDGAVAEREMLCLTVSIDHDIVDGAPAARFLQRFKEAIEHPNLVPGPPGQTPAAASE